MKTSTSPLDKKIEEWFDAIPSGVQKYFFLLSFVAGIFVSGVLTAAIVFALYTRRSGNPNSLAGCLSALAFLGFVIWATREMFRAFRNIGCTGDRTPTAKEN
ncbi:MAG: hypothetical protein WA876_07920 [Candidatus Acidiferrales bacterium]